MLSSSSDSSSSPAPTRKKRHIEAESSGSSDNHDTSDTTSAEEEDAPQPLLLTEATVLSHAERRRQKKKQKQNQPTATVASESPRKKRKLDDGTGTSNVEKRSTTTVAKAAPTMDDSRRLKRQNSVWVGNLSFWTTQNALRGFFDSAGMITRIHMPMRRGKQTPGENMGFAYVDFDTPEAKAIAITLSEGQLDGRNLLIKDGDDFTGRPTTVKTGQYEGGVTGAGGSEGEKAVNNAATAEGKSLSKTAQKTLRAQKQPPAPTLFLGNLGFETTEASIRELFEAHRYWGHKERGLAIGEGEGEGEGQGGDAAMSNDVWIRKIRMGTFEDSGNCKGFAFVDFTSIEHATEALINPRNHRLNGRDLVVEYASPEAVRRGGGPRRPKGDHAQKSGAGSGNASQKGSATAPHTKQRRPRQTGQEDDVEVADVPVVATATRSRRPERVDHDRSHTRRAKPGASLARAERQSAAILPSQGQKIIF